MLLCYMFVLIIIGTAVRSCAGARDITCGVDCNERSGSPSACIFPQYPKLGTYKASRFPDARPGQSRDSFVLAVSCRRGFGVVSPDGGDGSAQEVYCVNGEWLQEMPKCVRFCKLDPHPSVSYMCSFQGSVFRRCQKYVSPGTLVQPTCNGPIYYSAERLPYMKCTAGFWDYVAKCKAECGRVTPEGTQLLIDGTPAKRGELPWHAGVYRKTTRPYMQICGGSLVTNNVVISAAHCFWSDVNKLLKPSDFAVAAGKLHRRWDSEEDDGAQKSDIREIKVPRLFQGESANFQEDIAVLILSSAFIYKTYVRPACLNFDVNFDRWQLRQGHLGKVAGWGLTSSNGMSSQLLKVVELPFINVDVCITTLPLSFREYITGDKFCAGYTNGTALCKGDSGGGLAFPEKELGIDRYYLRGIVSAAPSSDGKLCNGEVYTAFTKITKHQDFINEALTYSEAKTCSLYSFQCHDGTCVEPGADCNGIQDCPDGSDEFDELCVAGFDIKTITSKPVCVLPPYPNGGSYTTNIAENISGQTSEAVVLNITCQPGYTLVITNVSLELNDNISGNNNTSGNIATGNNTTGNSGTGHSATGNSTSGYSSYTEVYCVNGQWDQIMPECIRKEDRVSCNKDDDTISDCNFSNKPTESISNKSDASCGWRNTKGLALLNDTDEIYEEDTLTTKFGEFPWMVAILENTTLSDTNVKIYVGGGSLIGRSVVLTAAQVVVNVDSPVVRAGDWDTQALTETYPHQIRNVAAVVIHDNFNKDNLFYDIAVLFLSEAIELAPNVGPVCLPPSGVRSQPGARCTATGWGKNKLGKGGRYQTVLNQVEVPVVDRVSCQEELRKTYLSKYFELHFSFMCAGGDVGKDTCTGDGGSPLVCPIKIGEERYMQNGIVSWGLGCGQKGSAYTEVAYLRDWIDEQVINRGYDTASYTI